MKKKWFRVSFSWLHIIQHDPCPEFHTLILSYLARQFRIASQEKNEYFGVAYFNHTPLFQIIVGWCIRICVQVPLVVNLFLYLVLETFHKDMSSPSCRVSLALLITSSIRFKISTRCHLCLWIFKTISTVADVGKLLFEGKALEFWNCGSGFFIIFRRIFVWIDLFISLPFSFFDPLWKVNEYLCSRMVDPFQVLELSWWCGIFDKSIIYFRATVSVIYFKNALAIFIKDIFFC